MTAQPSEPESEALTGSYDVIHLGDRSAVVVPMSDFLRLRALEKAASVEALEDAEDVAALEEARAERAAGTATYVPMSEARHRLGLER